MFIEDRFVYYHIPKTGGMWIRNRLGEHYEGESSDYWHLCNARLPKGNERKPSFAVVRNPWDWHVSWFYFWHAKKHVLKKECDGLRNKMIERTITYRTFTQYIKSESMTDYYDWMLPSDASLYRYEDGLGGFIDLLKTKFPPPNVVEIEDSSPVNVGDARPKDYRRCYPVELKSRVRRQEKLIIERFGYEF